MKICVSILLSVSFVFGGNLLNSKHNLSVSGPGEIKAAGESQICIFCHTSHHSNSQKGLWSQELSHVVYSTYSSSTLLSKPGQPDGTSKLCLSCHDGTVALGHVTNRDLILMSNTSGNRIPSDRHSSLGTSLNDDHPISFDPSEAVSKSSELQHPAPGQPMAYDAFGKIQCTTCHDSHDNRFGDFLVESNVNGTLCKSCHTLKFYNGLSTHDTSPATWSGMGDSPWSHTGYEGVSANSCQNCHRSHSAPGNEWLLNFSEEEKVCLVCHNSSGIGQNILSDIYKPSSHPVYMYQGQHEPNEIISRTSKHVECSDCHNPHQLNGSKSMAPMVQGVMNGVSGTDLSGNHIEEARSEWEVCVKCHGDEQYSSIPAVFRVEDTTNLRVAFSPSNRSFHPVINSLSSVNVSSLLPPFTSSSRIYCTDCHASNSSKKAGGMGANGPHGSSYPHLLERVYVTNSPNPFVEGDYALCFKCHSAPSIVNSGNSGFSLHGSHLKAQASCSACHDPHGSISNIALINFDTSIVFPNQNGTLDFNVQAGKGSCNLNCHAKEHVDASYERL